MSIANFEYYKVFYYVARLKNITSAASALFITQPSVSRSISNLESELNCTLFTRSKKGVELTPEGELLYKHIQVACKHIFSAEEEISLFSKSKGGIIRLGVSDAAFQRYTISQVTKFHNKYPEVKMKIDNMTTPVAIEALRANIIDIAIVTTPFADKKQLSVTMLDKLQDVLIAGKGFDYLQDKTISMHDIYQYPLICLQEGTTSRHYLDYIFRLHNILLKPDIELASINLVLPLVKNNLGIGFVPREMVEDDINQGELFEIAVKESLPARKICAVTCTKYQSSTIMKNFLENIAQEVVTT